MLFDGCQLCKMFCKEVVVCCVVFDCWFYLVFVVLNVCGLFNVNFNLVVLWWVWGGVVLVCYVLFDEVVCVWFLQEGGGGVVVVVVLDQGSCYWQKLWEESVVCVVFILLFVCLFVGLWVYFFKGGYEVFYLEYFECCVDVKFIL